MNWAALFLLRWSLVSSTIECPLRLNEADLLTLDELIVDTGSGDTILLQSGKLRSVSVMEVRYQSLVLETAQNSGPVLIKGCSEPLVVPRAHYAQRVETGPTGGGILGLGRKKLGDSLLFAPQIASWKTLSIQVAPVGGGMLVLKDANLRPAHTFPLNSLYYWATDVAAIRVGLPLVLPRQTAVIFDTGSNFFGLSPGLYRSVTETLIRKNCKSQLTFVVKSTTGALIDITYEPNIYALDPAPEVRDGTCSLAIGQIDQAKFGDLSNHEIVIIGTRGLKGKSLNIHKSSMNEYGFLISLN